MTASELTHRRAGSVAATCVYGVPTWGFAMMWLALAAAITVRTARRGLPFALTWWSFTLPVGTSGRLFKPI